MEKESIFELSMADPDCQEEALNQKILALYDQIEAATIENLEIAKKNSQLEVQIRTLKNVLGEEVPQATFEPELESQTSSSLQDQYDCLANEHMELFNRVSAIEQMLGWEEHRAQQGVRRDPPSLQKVSSIGVIGTQRRRSNMFQGQNSSMRTSIQKIATRRRKF